VVSEKKTYVRADTKIYKEYPPSTLWEKGPLREAEEPKKMKVSLTKEEKNTKKPRSCSQVPTNGYRGQ